MAVSSLSAAEASALSVRILGLEPETVDLTSREGLSASLRRAASFMCPTSPSRLVSAVLGAVSPLSSIGEVTRESLTNLLDLIVAAGDLLELRRDEDRSIRLLYRFTSSSTRQRLRVRGSDLHAPVFLIFVGLSGLVTSIRYSSTARVQRFDIDDCERARCGAVPAGVVPA